MTTDKTSKAPLSPEQATADVMQRCVQQYALLGEPDRADHQAILIKAILNFIGQRRQLKLNDADHEQLIKKITAEIAALPPQFINEPYSPKPSHKAGYPVVNPASEERVHAALNKVHGLVMEAIDIKEASNMAVDKLTEYLSPIINRVLDEYNIQLNTAEQTLLQIMLLDEMTGFGPLEPLLADESISDILVNGPNRIFIERHGKLQPCTISFRDNGHLLHVITRIVSKVGRRIDESVPYVDARLKDGSRVNAIIPPLALDAPTLSIRKFNKSLITLGKMVTTINLSAEMAALLTIAVRCRLNIVISGGTGSGKTTLLNALSRAIHPSERIITIEDSAELRLQQSHVVRLETRPPNIEGLGAVNERDLVRNALRMRPDRIILGEIRGAEAFDMLQAMNTGHDGSMCTVHANKPHEVPSRLVNMITMADVGISSAALMTQVAGVINLIVQINRMQDGKRRIIAISEINGVEDGEIKLRNLFEFKYNAKEGSTEIVGEYVRTADEPLFMPRAAQFGLDGALREIF